jgi:hypothetical protein
MKDHEHKSDGKYVEVRYMNNRTRFKSHCRICGMGMTRSEKPKRRQGKLFDAEHTDNASHAVAR